MATANETKRGNAKSSTNKSASGSSAKTRSNSATQSKSRSTSTRSNNSPRNSRKRKKSKQQREIQLWVFLAVSVFLLLANFGICGVVGNFVSGILFGLVGTVSYVLPVYLFFSAAFILSNGAQKQLIRRVLCVGIFLLVISFICQLVAGAEDMTVKLLYEIGSKNKRGGGVILGGILVLLYRFIGMTGSVILIILLTFIGFIIVLDISIVDLITAIFMRDYDEDDEDDYEDEDNQFAFEQIRERNKERKLLDNIKVLEGGNNKKKRKKKPVDDEEVHELKPLSNEEVENLEKQNLEISKRKKKEKTKPLAETPSETPIEAPITKTIETQPEVPVKAEEVAPVDEFDALELKILEAKEREAKEQELIHNRNSFEIDDGSNDQFLENYLEENNAVTELESVKRQRKKTKESYAEMVEARDEVAEYVASGNMTVASDITKKNDAQTSSKADSETVNEAFTGNNQQVTQNVPEKPYKLPPISLLRKGTGKGSDSYLNSVKETALKLKQTLANFGVNVTVTDFSCGPSVTRYEILPEQGVKVSKIVGLSDDIKLSLAATDIRIEAPIPGKSAIGIEVPNKESQAVYFRDLLESEAFEKQKSNIAFAVGKDIGGQVIVTDIAKMPHLLIAGATGSGKSVCINTLIMSILYKANPKDVKLIMIDPKQVELSVYNGIPHMLIPVVTDPKKATGALNWAVTEMTNRYQLFSQYNVRNLQGYNEKAEKAANEDELNGLKKLPQIVIIVDELADLMMVAHGEVEDAIVRLSQLARAAGIHLVIATQRPSVDVITGLIKANVPSRIAMSVSSGVDSRTILDMVGAEKLLGKGDMLFYPTGYPKPVRVQGAFLTDDEICEVCDYIKEQNGEGVVDSQVSMQITSSVGSQASSGSSDSDVDENFVDAGKFIISKEKASIGMLQRVYKIGFNRAARIMDQLSDAGVVGPEEGTKPRKVLMTMEEFENYVEENL